MKEDLKNRYFVPTDSYELNLEAAQLLAKGIGCKCALNRASLDYVTPNGVIRYALANNDVDDYGFRGNLTPITIEELRAMQSGEEEKLFLDNATLQKAVRKIEAAARCLQALREDLPRNLTEQRGDVKDLESFNMTIESMEVKISTALELLKGKPKTQ